MNTGNKKKILTMDEMMQEQDGSEIILNQLDILGDTANKMSFKIQHLEILIQSLIEVLKKHDAFNDEELQQEIENTATNYVKQIKEAQQKSRPSEVLTQYGKIKTS